MKAKKFLALAAAVLTMSCVSVPVFAETDPFTTYPIRIEQQEKEGFKLSGNILTKTDKSGTYGYTGRVKVGGKKKYYDNGVQWTGWRKINKKWYYFDPDNDGIMAEGKVKTSLGYYYFDDSGAWNGKLSKSAKYPDDFDFMMSDLAPDPISGCEINTYEGLIKAPDEYNDDYSRKIKLSKRDKQIFYDVIMSCKLTEIKDGLYGPYLYEINKGNFGEDESVAIEITDSEEYTTKFTANGKTHEIHGGYIMYEYYKYENSTAVRNYAYFLAFARQYIRDTPQYAKISEANWKAKDKVNEDEWGLKLTAKDVSPTGCTLVFTQSGGTADRLSTDFYFSLQRLENGQWTQVRMLPQEYDVAWSRVEWEIKTNGSVEYKENWQSLYGELRKGQYRICKEITDQHKAGDNDRRTFYAYFEISNKETSVTSTAKKYPALTALTEEQENKLKEDFAVYKSNKWTDAKSEEMFIMRYYGTYNGNEVVVMWRSEYDTTSDLKEVTVGNRTFILESGSYEILLHKNSGFIDINTAYAEGYLTDEDIEAIYYYANNKI